MAVMSIESLPGFGFHPSDEMLVNFYLMRKIKGRKQDVEMIGKVIAEIDVCKCEPWDLPCKSLIRSDDLEWFFFSPRDRKYPNGNRSNRATNAGYWKATGKDREIKSRGLLIGMKKTLVFYRGRAPSGEKTDWIIHEYRVTDNKQDAKNGGQGSFVLCRLFDKSDEKIGNSNCDEIDEKIEGPNYDEIEQSGLSPTTTKSSPEEVRQGGDACVQFEDPLNQGIPMSNMQETPQSLPGSIEKQLVNIERWLGDEEDKPEDSLCNSNMASDFEDHEAASEVDTLLQDFGMFYEPTFGPLNPQGFSQLDSQVPMGLEYPCADSPFYDCDMRGQQIGLTQDSRVDPDTSSLQSVNDFLESVLNNDQDEYSSFEDSSCLKDPVVNTKRDVLPHEQGGPAIEGHSSMLLYSPYKNMGPFYNDSAEPTSVDDYATGDSLQGIFNTFKEPTVWNNSTNSGVDLDGTGVKIRGRLSPDVANSDKIVLLGGSDNTNAPKLVAQSGKIAHGLAPRRIRLQGRLSGPRKQFMKPVFGNGSESNSDADDHETKSAITETKEIVEDTATTDTGASRPIHVDKLDNHATKSSSAASSAALPLAAKSSNITLLDADSNREITQESNLRLRGKRRIEIGYSPEHPSVQLEASCASFLSKFVVYVTLIIVLVIMFVWVWRCFKS
ncbi:protein NTM1-like 9 isoform X2 [Tasmannia lanceolata]|uniref:protein NTM1-like 9 isoform X2 n=1 Tax=Tasmannia lanceolata TaxID=3420 RepID=UPI004062BA02